MTDSLDLTQIFNETIARVRARMDSDVNAGLEFDDPAFIDTREGGFYWDLSQVSALEATRLWDAFTEVVAAAFPSTAWGDYLDEHGATFGLTRSPAVAASGQVLINTTQAITLGIGTAVTAPPVQPSGDALTFLTTESGTSADPLTAPGSLVATPSGTGGTLPAGTYSYQVTTLNLFGESTPGLTVNATTTGSTSKVTLGWAAVAGATGYRVYRGGLLVALVVDPTVAYVDTGAVTPTTPVPDTNLTSGMIVDVVCSEEGSDTNVSAGAINEMDTQVPEAIAVTNEAQTTGGADEEDDDSFRQKVLGQFRGQSGGGNVNDYKRWALQQGIPRVTVVPVWNGAGTVLVVAMQLDGSPVTTTQVTDLQNFLDPVAGAGHGQAPVGATVTVKTSTLITPTFVAVIVHETGYSLDGAGGTIPTRQPITDSVDAYLQSLQPGDSIIYQHASAAFFVPGVHKLTSMTINGAGADIALSASPTPQVARAGTMTLS